MMPSHEAEIAAARLGAAQELYAEFFLLMERETEEDPLTEPTGGLDQTIARLMDATARAMTEYRDATARARAAGALPPALEAAIGKFEEDLRAGLRIMSDRLAGRMGALRETRERLKEKILQVRHKRHGAQGYRSHQGKRTRIDSRI